MFSLYLSPPFLVLYLLGKHPRTGSVLPPPPPPPPDARDYPCRARLFFSSLPNDREKKAVRQRETRGKTTLFHFTTLTRFSAGNADVRHSDRPDQSLDRDTLKYRDALSNCLVFLHAGYCYGSKIHLSLRAPVM